MNDQSETPLYGEDPQVSGRNDPAIDGGLNEAPASESTTKAPKDPQPASDPVAKDNEFSPDFKSEQEPKPETDADIDTPGG
ncbi:MULTISPECIES: hypothetical protein [unclassified Pseudomonas]|uniref:hypothetical protein n=1 Tax=unclassified Pseudomonas TaxID=196821 RepID=UPI0011ED703F|nr:MULTISPECIES: hypothetical protein [unclassified Pseudomonas]KAA0943532.1 hypothetical protein FQ182_24615 [Pseudomonas sp. ANT_H4]KAA0950010.1 hypothetical protein FQ186_21420 [Pseudomonas sp. ANT_H14]